MKKKVYLWSLEDGDCGKVRGKYDKQILGNFGIEIVEMFSIFIVMMITELYK